MPTADDQQRLPPQEAPANAQDEAALTAWDAASIAASDAELEALLVAPERLAAVHASGLLDSPPEDSFDALSRLAVTLVGAPVSFLSVVDADRDVYKSQCGFPEPLAAARTLRGRTFCHLALLQSGALVIADTLASPVWRAVPTMQSLGVRAYLGVPLVVGGQTIGSFCAIDFAPREWTATQVETMTELARSAAREIALRAALHEATAEAARAHALARANEELLAVVSHDLRSPLQVITLSAALLARGADAPAQVHLKRLTGAADAMKRLVDDLLVLHAGMAPGSGRAPIAAERMLVDTLETLQSVADRAGIRLTLDVATPGAVLADYAQLLRALCNLVGNCIKYCPAGSTVVLGAADAGADRIALRVADDGPGMGGDEPARAFDRGWQGSLGRARQDGAGLGLAIVRDLVERNGGRVALTSAAGSGTTITLTLPRADYAAPA